MTGSSQRRIARRLEELRKERGFTSLRAFHEALVERTEESFSYTALRNYHDDDPEKGRTPPVGYLNTVSQVFGVRLGWLIRGEEPMNAVGASVDAWLREGVGKLEEEFPAIRRWPTWARERLFELTARQGYGADEAAKLVALITGPLEAPGLGSLEELSAGEIDGYFGAMLGALSILVHRVRSSEDGSEPRYMPVKPHHEEED